MTTDKRVKQRKTRKPVFVGPAGRTYKEAGIAGSEYTPMFMDVAPGDDEHRNRPQTVPCKYCGQPTQMTGTRQCDWCWEFTGRLDKFLQIANQAGIQLVADAIKATGKTQEIRRCLNT